MPEVSSRPLLLLVEDHEDTRQMYAEFLGMTFEVMQARDGAQALTTLEQRVPVLVITDFALPGIDGLELTRRIRVNQSTRHVPVICLSGYSGETLAPRAQEVGCDRMLEKPCLPDQLAQVAREMAARGRAS
jgi:two-component system, cell cycle response regulator DivK